MKLLITGGSGFIGSNFIDYLLSQNLSTFINIDKQAPINSKHNSYWVNCNILDKSKLKNIFNDYNPTHILHLAAKTDTASEKLEDYIENTEGTYNLIQEIEKSNSVRHIIITSTQYVYKSKENFYPQNDIHFIPHTAYGISKKINEESIRNSSIKCTWTIIRPTNVWGPWNMRYPNELLKIIDKGLYFHPKNSNSIKSYAYVKNVVHQVCKIIESPSEKVHQKVFYVGDNPMNSTDWINGFSMELTGNKVKQLPISVLRVLAYLGDFIKILKIPFPLHSVRFNNMIDNYLTPMQKTIDEFGISHPTFDQNVKETIDWIKNEGKQFFEYWKNKKT